MSRGTRHRRQGIRALVLVALLASGGLLALAPSAPAQAGAPLLCFDRDPQAAQDAGSCRADATAPDYVEGERVGITLQNVGTTPYVRARCLTDCHELRGREYYAVWRGERLEFPVDFTDPGPSNDAPSAISEKAGRYNSTWEITALLAGQPITRSFNQWIYDMHHADNRTVQPGAVHRINPTGFQSYGEVEVRVERRALNGTWVRVHGTSPGDKAAANGEVILTWSVPKDEALRLQECGLDLDHCYRVVSRGQGKDEEVVPIRMAFAEIKPGIFGRINTTDTGERPAIMRTANVTLGIAWHYPSGRHTQGPAMLPSDVPLDFASQEVALRVEVLKQTLEGSERIATLPMRYAPAKLHWEVTWNVPRDLETGQGITYSVKVLDQQDSYGNRVVPIFLGNYTVTRATLVPVLVHGFAEAPRATPLNFSFHIAYLNGTLFTPEHNATTLEGCFVRVERAAPECTGAERVVAKYEAPGLWAFHVKYPRDYAALDAHRFILLGGAGRAEDKWGNLVQGVTPDDYLVVPARPLIDFATVMRGRETQVLERGASVTVEAFITYPDGTPFNHTVNVNRSQTLVASLVKRGPGSPYGAIQDQVDVVLTQRDSERGFWMGSIQLTRDDTDTPLGRWSFELAVGDELAVQNFNRSVFDRDVVGVPLRLIEDRATPRAHVLTGETQTFRFRLTYDDGAPVPPASIRHNLLAQVYRYNPDNGSAYGDSVSGPLRPSYNDATGYYMLEWIVPPHLFQGTYAFVVTGGDVHGNLLATDAYSRSFTTSSEVRARSALTQPSLFVPRGEVATVVFDRREGDAGVEGAGLPVIHLDRFDTTLNQWVGERFDVRTDAPEVFDHVGVFPVTTTTPVGLYRFVLAGRDADFKVIHGVSRNFTVNATDVARAIYVPPPERVVKGELFAFTIERLEGDRYVEVQVFQNGRLAAMQAPVMASQGGQINVTWKVPFEAPVGNYSLRMRGFDLYGNRIDLLTPSFTAEAASLTGKILGAPARVVSRGEEASLLFGVTYPDGAFYVSSATPRVSVVDGRGDYVAQATVAQESLTFRALWTPPPQAEEGEYFFEVSGEGVGGNLFPTLRSQGFRVASGELSRAPAGEPPVSIQRMAAGVLEVPYQDGDRFVGFTLDYFGVSVDATGALFDTREPLSSVPLAHTLDTTTGRYVARFVTDEGTPTGTYRIRMEGEDAYGNIVESRSRPFLVRSTNILVTWDAFPPQQAFVEGGEITVSFVARYQAGTVMDDLMGRPSAVVLLEGQPLLQRPEIAFREGRWFLTWQIPEVLRDGNYMFSVGGQDLQGNTIASSTTIPYFVQTDTVESLSKVVPGPSPILLLLGALLVALLAGRKLHR